MGSLEDVRDGEDNLGLVGEALLKGLPKPAVPPSLRQGLVAKGPAQGTGDAVPVPPAGEAPGGPERAGVSEPLQRARPDLPESVRAPPGLTD